MLDICALGNPALASADFTTFSDRVSWESAVAGSLVQSENFDSAVSDVVFTNSSTSIGEIGLTATGDAAGSILIDVVPGE